ncbi:MAG: ATP synthase F1 subunit gamma [Candidatus Omnitrophota bacterium]|nr:ATP synthase F1 subunit gamma [Candidatus Omnitrophota bacterium]
MASLRQIRQRLRSIQNTKQIMRAMQLVSGSKLKRSQAKLLQVRMVLEFLDGLRRRLLTEAGASSQDHPRAGRGARPPREGWTSHPLCAHRDAGPSALILFTSDAGLCGSYNTNLIQLAEAHLRRDAARSTQLIFIGKKGHRYFTKRGYPAAEAYLDLAGRPDLAKAEAIARRLMDRFLAGELSSIHLLYSRFVSATTYRPMILPWLPVHVSPVTQSPSHPVTRGALEYIFEPSPQRVFDDLLPRWTLATFQRVMLEAFTSEHSARMIAMKNATDNAEEILKTLTTQRNNVRQASITKELSEIVGTAEALK